MNLIEALELHKTVMAFQNNNTKGSPRLRIFNTLDQNGGYVLCVEASSASRSYLGLLRSLAEASELGIRHFRGYLVLYST